MAIRQARVFVPSCEPVDEPGVDWVATMIGRVFGPVTEEYAASLPWFWFSWYAAPVGEDSKDCDITKVSNEYKHSFPGENKLVHLSIRFRYNVDGSAQRAFEGRLKQVAGQYGYYVSDSDVLDYNQVEDTGGRRFLAAEKLFEEGRAEKRAELVTLFYHATARLVIDCLVGPDDKRRFRMETNADLEQNPHGSTFESLHHLFCNITRVPLSILIKEAPSEFSLRTHWGWARPARKSSIDSLPYEMFLPF
jgi:hypothetical protein